MRILIMLTIFAATINTANSQTKMGASNTSVSFTFPASVSVTSAIPNGLPLNLNGIMSQLYMVTNPAPAPYSYSGYSIVRTGNYSITYPIIITRVLGCGLQTKNALCTYEDILTGGNANNIALKLDFGTGPLTGFKLQDCTMSNRTVNCTRQAAGR